MFNGYIVPASLLVLEDEVFLYVRSLCLFSIFFLFIFKFIVCDLYFTIIRIRHLCTAFDICIGMVLVGYIDIVYHKVVVIVAVFRDLKVRFTVPH